MSYTPKVWRGHEYISADDMNRLEAGVKELVDAVDDLTVDGTLHFNISQLLTEEEKTRALTNLGINPLSLTKGGTGVSLSANPSLLVDLASSSAANIFTSAPRAGVTGILSTANGGTGNTTGTALLATTNVDTENIIYPVGVTSGATTALKRNTSITMQDGIFTATTIKGTGVEVGSSGLISSGAIVTDKKNFYVKQSNITVGVTPSQSFYGDGFYLRDSQDYFYAYLRTLYSSEGKLGLQLEARRPVDGNSKYNTLNLLIDDEGNANVMLIGTGVVPAWRTALGLQSETSGELNVTWNSNVVDLSATTSESTTNRVYYVKRGGVVHLQIVVKLLSTVTQTFETLTLLNANQLPKAVGRGQTLNTLVDFNTNTTNHTFAAVGTNGGLTIYARGSLADRYISICGTYIAEY